MSSSQHDPFLVDFNGYDAISNIVDNICSRCKDLAAAISGLNVVFMTDNSVDTCISYITNEDNKRVGVVINLNPNDIVNKINSCKQIFIEHNRSNSGFVNTLSEEQWFKLETIVKRYFYHEMGHLFLTDYNTIDEAMSGFVDPSTLNKTERRAMALVINAAEDARVETKIVDQFPGMYKYFLDDYNVLVENVVKPKLEEEFDYSILSSYVFIAILMPYLLGIGFTADTLPLENHPFLYELAKKILDPSLRAANSDTSEECVEIVLNEIWPEIKSVLETDLESIESFKKEVEKQLKDLLDNIGSNDNGEEPSDGEQQTTSSNANSVTDNENAGANSKDESSNVKISETKLNEILDELGKMIDIQSQESAKKYDNKDLKIDESKIYNENQFLPHYKINGGNSNCIRMFFIPRKEKQFNISPVIREILAKEENIFMLKIAPRLRKVLQDNERQGFDGAYYSGKHIDTHGLRKYVFKNDTRIFQKPYKHDKKSYVFYFMVDGSGSMGSIDRNIRDSQYLEKSLMTASSSYCFSRLLTQLNIPHKIDVWSTLYPCDSFKSNQPIDFYRVKNRVSSESVTIETSTNDYVSYITIKDFDEKIPYLFESQEHKLLAFSGLFSTPEYDAVRYGIEVLSKRTEEKKVLIILTDGLPGSNVSSDVQVNIITKELYPLAEANKIDIINIEFVDGSPLNDFHKNAIYIRESISELEDSLIYILKKVLFNE